MKARVSSHQLQSAVSTLALIERVDVSGNEILLRAFEDVLMLRVVSGSIVIESYLACDAIEFGECAVLIKTFLNIIKKAHDQDINLEFDDKNKVLKVQARKWKSKMPASLNVAMFEVAEVDIPLTSVNSGQLFETLGHVNLMGRINKHRVHDWEKGAQISYNAETKMFVVAFGFGAMFAECRFRAGEGIDKPCIVPFQSTEIIQKIIESSDTVDVGTNGLRFIAKTKKFKLQSPVISDSFPDYTRYFGSGLEEIEFNRKDLQGAVGRVNPLGEDSICLTGEIESDSLKLSCDSSQVQAVDVLSVSGSGLKFCLNPRYLSHVLSSMEAPHVNFSVGTGKLPICVISPKDDEQQVGIRYIVAQIRGK